MDISCSALLSRGSQSILELKIWILHVVHFYLAESILDRKNGFTCRALLSTGSESILGLKIWILLVVYFSIGGMRSSWSSNIEISVSAPLYRGSESILELKIWIFHVVHFHPRRSEDIVELIIRIYR